MNLISVCDRLVSQIDKAIIINAREREEAFASGDISYFNCIERFSRRLNGLEAKARVLRAEVTDLSVHGCSAVATDYKKWLAERDTKRDAESK